MTYVYKLRTILDETLYFDVDLNYIADIQHAGTEINGDGSGTLGFNTKTNQVSKVKFYSELEMKLDLGDFEMVNVT